MKLLFYSIQFSLLNFVCFFFSHFQFAKMIVSLRLFVTNVPGFTFADSWVANSDGMTFPVLASISFRSNMISVSSFVRKDVATPVLPALPVRPMRCVYFSMSWRERRRKGEGGVEAGTGKEGEQAKRGREGGGKRGLSEKQVVKAQIKTDMKVKFDQQLNKAKKSLTAGKS